MGFVVLDIALLTAGFPRWNTTGCNGLNLLPITNTFKPLHPGALRFALWRVKS